MPGVFIEIYDALEGMGYNLQMNDSETGFTFNFNLELAVCRFDDESNVVTFIVPSVRKIDLDEEYDEAVRRVNSRNHVGRLVNIDGSAISAVSSFLVCNLSGIESQVRFAIEDLNRLIEDFYKFIVRTDDIPAFE